MRVIFFGSREWTDVDAVRAALIGVIGIARGGSVTVVHGAARGADSLAARAAMELGIATESHPAEWGVHDFEGLSGVPCRHAVTPTCKAAGIRRNEKMARLGADLAIGFTTGDRLTTGSQDMAKRAYRVGIPTYVVRRYEPLR